MKPILALVLIFLVGHPLCAFVQTNEEEPAAKQQPPAGKEDETGADSEDQRPGAPSSRCIWKTVVRNRSNRRF